MGWGACAGYVAPTTELCDNNIDEDCNGVVDDVPDLDGDGWTVCDGDCCDTAGTNCADPALVNPGAFEFVGNQVDDDCNPATLDSTAAASCSNQASFSASASQIAAAMELCQMTTANPSLDQKTWGMLDVELVHADGSHPAPGVLSTIENNQVAVLTDYGVGGVVPTQGPTMAGISSGRMRDASDPGFIQPNMGVNWGIQHQANSAYLAAHGGSFPSSQGCNGTCVPGFGANDSVNLRLTIRVPTNAFSFSYDFRFFSSEYWTWSCTAYNDFYLALLTSSAAGIPTDRNISFDSLGNPVSVNNGFYESCMPKGCYSCPDGIGALQGTGMEYGYTGGATKWLTTTAPVVPGETMTLELMIFDVSDNILDSLTLLDNFQWSITPSAVGTEPTGSD